MSLNGGDALARGAKSAQFAGASSISQFEDDLIFRPETVSEKYGLTEEQIAAYKLDREEGRKLPELSTVAEMQEMKTSELQVGFSVKDNRRLFVMEPEAQPVQEAPKKWAEYKYGPMKTILDRVLVKRVPDDPNLELCQDGTVRNKVTGLVVPAAYRQHSNIGIVLAVGDFVVMGGVKTPLSDFIKPGDKVKYGDYNSEVYFLSDEEVEKLCDAVFLNFAPDPEGLRIIRVQDIRSIQHRVPSEETAFNDSYYWNDEQARNPVLDNLASGGNITETVITSQSDKGRISAIVPVVQFKESE